MSSLKDYKGRISTLKNMQKVMRAMNMIATIKLRKLFRLQSSLSLFEQSTERIAQDINKASMQSSSVLISGFKDVKRCHVVIFTADKGLCGSHNSSVHKALDFFVRDKTDRSVAVDVTCVGLRGAKYCRRKGYNVFSQTEINERTLDAESIKKITSKVFERFLSKEIQEIYLISNYFRSTLVQNTVTTQLIPFIVKGTKKEKWSGEISTEPGSERFFIAAGELHLFYKLMSALYNSYLSEQSSRMTAMDNATHNSEDLINHYMMLQNRARQAAITNDLIEIISGKEALKG